MKFKNLGKKIATAGLAAAMVMSMSAPVFADTTTVAKTGEEGSQAYTAVKSLYSASGVTLPDSTTFNFSIEPASKQQILAANTARTNDQNLTSDQKYTAVAGKSLTKSIAATVTSTSSTNVATSALFSDSDFRGNDDKPGIYAYQVKETAGSDAEHFGYDDTVYYVEVKVDYDSTVDTNSDGEADGANVISGITAQKVTTGDGGAITLGNKAAAIAFNNSYKKYGNEDTSGGGDTSKGLEIKKTVTGTAKGSSGNFDFTITFTKDQTEVGTGSGKYVNDGMDLQATSALKYTKDGKEQTVSANTNLEYGTEYTFSLTDGGKIDFMVPAGTTYTVTESDSSASGYSTTYKVNGAAAATEGKSAANQSISATTANSVEFLNNKDNSPLTGLVNNYGGLLAVVAIAAAGIVFVMVHRRRYAD